MAETGCATGLTDGQWALGEPQLDWLPVVAAPARLPQLVYRAPPLRTVARGPA